MNSMLKYATGPSFVPGVHLLTPSRAALCGAALARQIIHESSKALRSPEDREPLAGDRLQNEPRIVCQLPEHRVE